MKKHNVLILLMTCVAIPLRAEQTAPPAAEVLLKTAMATPILNAGEDGMTGEGVAWHAAWHAAQFIDLAEQTGDPSYIETAIDYYDALLDKSWLSPDGYRGWVGPYIYDKTHNGDVHISDAILVNPMLRVAEFILHGTDSELRKKHEATAHRYVDYARKHIIEKWDARDTWWTDGVYGGYFAWNKYLNADKSSWERDPEVRNSALGLPFNKNLDLAITHLRLFRLTGNPEYRERARLIFDSFKSRLCLFKNSYTWNYWEPVYPKDILSVNSAKMGHWVGTHPYRDYQAGEIECVIEAYHNGLTFDEADLDRFVSTNLMMWNGNYNEPDFVNSDFAVWKSARPDYEEPEPSSHYGGPAGALWKSLTPFSEPLARLGTVRAENLNKQREYLFEPDLFDFPFQSSQLFSMVFALPSVLQQGESLIAGCKVRDQLDVEVQLVSGDGKTVVDSLRQTAVEWEAGGHGGLFFFTWEADCPPGAYRLRWISGEDYRDFPIQVQ